MKIPAPSIANCLCSLNIQLVDTRTALALICWLVVACEPSAMGTQEILGRNLVVNGDAETGTASATGYEPVNIPGWQKSGGATVVRYGTSTLFFSFPGNSDPGPENRGRNFFSGGADNASSSLWQLIEVEAAAALIDAGQVTYNLSGYLGGWDYQDDAATVTATFKNASGTTLGTARLPSVLAAQREQVTGLFGRATNGSLPTGTRSVEIRLTMIRAADWFNYDNDGYADNLSFLLFDTTLSKLGLVIYDDAFVNGWYTNYSKDLACDLENPTPVQAGTHSICLQLQANQSFVIRHAEFNACLYSHLTFWIHGGPSGGQRLTVQALNQDRDVTLLPLLPNAWQLVSLPLSDLGRSGNTQLQGWAIKDRSGVSQPAFYLDDIVLLRVPLPEVAHEFFDDFTYANSADPELAAFGWIVEHRKNKDETGRAGPGFDEAYWSRDQVEFVGDTEYPVNRLLRLSARTQGDAVTSVQSWMHTGFRFYEGTYAARVRLSDAPSQGTPDGDHVVEAPLYSISPWSENNPIYSECDFEYLPNGDWNGRSEAQMHCTTWETTSENLAWRKNTNTWVAASYAGPSWHTLLFHVLDQRVIYYLDGTLVAEHVGIYYPESLMMIALQLWFEKLTSGTSEREYTMDVDWIFHGQGLRLETVQVEQLVAQHRLQGMARWDTMDVADPRLARIHVNANQAIRTVEEAFFGLNVATWDAHLSGANQNESISLLKDLGVQALRFPGGSTADEYLWFSNSSLKDGKVQLTDFSGFVTIAKAIGSKSFITVNYGSGTAQEAANWVFTANIAGDFPVKYWEIGNENYGDWEFELPDKNHDPVTYATRAKDYWDKMKAIDNTIKIGVVAVPKEDDYPSNHEVTNPRTGVKHRGWTPIVLSTLKQLQVFPDFVIHHRYAQQPYEESDAVLLQSSSAWSDDIARLRQQLDDYLGSMSSLVEIMATENNSVSSRPGKQTASLVNALFLADSFGQGLQQKELRSLAWWDLRNDDPATTNNNGSSLYGWREYGTYGLITGANTKLPSYYTYKLTKYFARAQDRIVNCTVNQTLLSAYAAKKTDGSLSLLVINKSPLASISTAVSIQNFSPNSAATVYSYGMAQDNAAKERTGSPDLAQTSLALSGPAFNYTFPPYSATVILMKSIGGSPSISPGGTRFVPGQQFTFNILGTPGSWIRIEASTDLSNWIALDTISLNSSNSSFSDTTVSLHRNRFYRLIPILGP